MNLNWRQKGSGVRSNQRTRGQRARQCRPLLEALEDRLVPTVHPVTSFPGMSFVDTASGATPPDTIMAVGPSVVVEAVNTAIEITDKSGNVLMPPEELALFFGSVFGEGDGFTDPYVIYDDQAQRFYVGVLETRTSPEGNQFALFDFAVSKTASPQQASDWTVFTKLTSVSKNGTEFPDFPKMGFNADAVFVSFNWFGAASGNFDDNLVLAIDKNSILNPGPGLNPALTTFQTEVKTGSDHDILIPARMHGGPSNLEYFAQTPNDGKNANVVTETNYLTSNPTFNTTTIKVNAYQDSPGVPELTLQIDDRMLSAEWLDNRLVAAQDVGLSDGLNHARAYEFDTSGASPVLVQEADISPGAGISTSYPSIAINTAGDIGMTFIQSASNTKGTITQTPSMYITGWAVGDALNTLDPPTLIQAGVAGSAAGFRGGDYSATVVDPSNQSFWSAQQYAADNIISDDWGTAIANYTVVFGPLVSALSPAADQEGSAGFTLTVNGGNFTNSSVVEWNGTPLTTNFVNPQKVTATVTSSLLTEDGTFPVTVHDPSEPSGETDSNAVNFTVTEAALKAGTKVTLSDIHAGATFNRVLANFSDPDVNEPLGDYQATISWGDKTANSVVGVISVSAGKYQVKASHVYSTAATRTITITITDDGLNPLVIADKIVITSSAHHAHKAITLVDATKFNGVLASFTAPNPLLPAGAYAAVINWGDGTASTVGRINRLGEGRFSVLGTHTYTKAGEHLIMVTIRRGADVLLKVDVTVIVA